MFFPFFRWPTFTTRFCLVSWFNVDRIFVIVVTALLWTMDFVLRKPCAMVTSANFAQQGFLHNITCNFLFHWLSKWIFLFYFWEFWTVIFNRWEHDQHLPTTLSTKTSTAVPRLVRDGKLIFSSYKQCRSFFSDVVIGGDNRAGQPCREHIRETKEIAKN